MVWSQFWVPLNWVGGKHRISSRRCSEMCLNLWACSCEWWTHGMPAESSRVNATAIPCGVEEQPGSRSLQSWDTLLEYEWWLHGFRCQHPPTPLLLSLYHFLPAMNSISKRVLSGFSPQVRLPKIPMMGHLLFADSMAPSVSGYPKDSSIWHARASHPAHFVDLPLVFPAFSTQPVGLLSFSKQPSCLTVSAAHPPRTLFLPLPHHKWAFARDSP